MVINDPVKTNVHDTRQHLANAKQQAKDRNLTDYTIVDVDAHHYETESWGDIVKYIEDPVIRYAAEAGINKAFSGGMHSMVPSQLQSQDMSGRITRYHDRKLEKEDEGMPREVSLMRRSMDMMGIDYTVLFPTPLLNLGLHPAVEMEVALGRAYTRWITENILSVEDRIKTLVYLPFNDPEASVKMIEEFGHKKGVVGFMITSVRYKPVHHNHYMKVYAAIEETGLPLGFHAAYNWHGDRSMEQLNKFISVHALGFPFYNMIHMTNFVINGIPERFPKLKVMWIESGLAWIPFLMQRLDNEYMMRTSEAPALTKLPSDYMREFYYTSQPMEQINNHEMLKATFNMINAENQLLYSSDWPHWDFDLPRTIYDLPFVSEQGKRNILGETALQLFRLKS